MTSISTASKLFQSNLWAAMKDNKQLQSIIQSEAAIVFDSPARIMPDESGRLSLWLYSVSMNESFRNLMPSADNPSRGGQAPVQLNLHYLLTPFCKTSEQEHVLLDGVIRFLHDHPILEQLNPDESTFSKADISIVNLTITELTNLWSALQVPIRPSIACQLRLSPGMRV